MTGPRTSERPAAAVPRAMRAAAQPLTSPLLLVGLMLLLPCVALAMPFDHSAPHDSVMDRDYYSGPDWLTGARALHPEDAENAVEAHEEMCALLAAVRGQDSTYSRRPHSSGDLLLITLQQMCTPSEMGALAAKAAPRAEQDVLWPTYLPLRLAPPSKRRWGDSIGACIQSNCNSFSGASRVGCIVQRCQRKRGAWN